MVSHTKKRCLKRRKTSKRTKKGSQKGGGDKNDNNGNTGNTVMRKTTLPQPSPPRPSSPLRPSGPLGQLSQNSLQPSLPKPASAVAEVLNNKSHTQLEIDSKRLNIFNRFKTEYGRDNVSLDTTYDDIKINSFFNQHLKKNDDFHIILTESSKSKFLNIKIVMGVFKGKVNIHKITPYKLFPSPTDKTINVSQLRTHITPLTFQGASSANAGNNNNNNNNKTKLKIVNITITAINDDSTSTYFKKILGKKHNYILKKYSDLSDKDDISNPDILIFTGHCRFSTTTFSNNNKNHFTPEQVYEKLKPLIKVWPRKILFYNCRAAGNTEDVKDNNEDEIRKNSFCAKFLSNIYEDKTIEDNNITAYCFGMPVKRYKKPDFFTNQNRLIKFRIEDNNIKYEKYINDIYIKQLIDKLLIEDKCKCKSNDIESVRNSIELLLESKITEMIDNKVEIDIIKKNLSTYIESLKKITYIEKKVLEKVIQETKSAISSHKLGYNLALNNNGPNYTSQIWGLLTYYNIK